MPLPPPLRRYISPVVVVGAKVTCEVRGLVKIVRMSAVSSCARPGATEQWVAAHMTPEQAADSLLDAFKRAVRQELELLAVECSDGKFD